MTTNRIQDFWAIISEQLSAIREDKPTTVAEIIDILGGSEAASAGDAFFAGSGGDDQLADALRDAGWRIRWIEAPYYYTATHPATGESLTYIEGDVDDNSK